MNIYFSGIGGVGVGPLAEIASDAGYRVVGSDSGENLMTSQLRGRGVEISAMQDGVFLEAQHQSQPIDWFVYTAALPPEHPELTKARELGIRTTKRDELLVHILSEKRLKLLAVSGTHGKTTTTGMLVWALQQLGVPTSYALGTTISFGPSGKYVPDSKYFVYECDEFDRNMLSFHPYLSIITSLGYDHSDTYSTQADYLDAFTEFTQQSGHTIGWQHDLANLTTPASTLWQLNDDEVIDVALAGEHNRRNATLAAKACEYLGLEGSHSALARFPGTHRRFEMLDDNLYTDYGHHPSEIAATLQLASELSKQIVLVYQPHQNVRQYEVKAAYTDCFTAAESVYWLPTYLSRENTELAVLSPQELSENVTNKDSVHYSEMNDDLWQTIQSARSGGKLVLCMGAGSIDAWVRSKLT